MRNNQIINCKYHPTKLNQSWCSQCGNPICKNCIADIPKWLMGFGHPDLCPHCKQKKLKYSLKIISIIVASTLTIISLVHFLLVNLYTFIFSVLGVSFLYLYFIGIYFKEKQKYYRWRENITERDISEEEIQKLIQNHSLDPCEYHATRPCINKCEFCGLKICTTCSITFNRFLEVNFSCIKCFWGKRKRDLKIFLGFSGIPFILLMIILAFTTIAYWGQLPYSFYLAYLLVSSFFGILFGAFVLSYKKSKQKYDRWQNEVAKLNSS